MAARDRAEPNIMVTLSAPLEITIVLGKYLPYFLFVFSHYKAILSWRSDTKDRSRKGTLGSFNASNSGAAKRKRSIKASKDPDSNTRPGISVLVATQTPASSSQVKLITYFMLRYLPNHYTANWGEI